MLLRMKIDRKKLEIIVLVAGVTIIAIAAIMLFMRSSPSQIFWTNLVFAIGFLVYIVYSMLNTSSLNKANTQLKEEVEKQKQDIEKKDRDLRKKDGDLKKAQSAKKELDEKVASLQKEVEQLRATDNQGEQGKSS